MTSKNTSGVTPLAVPAVSNTIPDNQEDVRHGDIPTTSFLVQGKSNALLTAALEWAAMGFSVHPCKPDKKPHLTGWPDEAATDPEKIKRWWKQWPNALIGLATGEKSGIWALDIDVKNGKNGYESLKELTVQYGSLPATRAHSTPNGGEHFFFSCPKDGLPISNSTSRIAEGIDVRGTGGYVILPPSNNYAVIYDSPIAEAPEWLIELARNKGKGKDKSHVVDVPVVSGEDIPKHHDLFGLNPYVQAAVTAEIEKLKSTLAGKRNDVLNTTACKLGNFVAGGELPEDLARQLLTEAGEYCGLDEEEGGKEKIQNTIRSGLEAGKKQPRSAPDNNARSGERPAKSQPTLYTVYSGEDILAWPDPQWRVEDVLPETGLAAIYGESRAGKSFLALDLALTVTRGAYWFGFETTPCPVLYINLESSWGLQGRLKAWETAYHEKTPESLSFITQAFSLLEENNILGIIEAAQGKGMVIIDTLNRASPGADENSSKDMGRLIQAATRIQEAIDGLVLIVAHTGKDGSRGLRGHSSLPAAIDTGILVERDKDYRKFKLDKVKEGQDGIVKPFQLRIIPIGHDKKGKEVTSCVAVPDYSRQGKEKPLSANQRLALNTFDTARGENEGVDTETWRPVFYEKHTGDKADTKKKAFDRARKELVDMGILDVKDGFYTHQITVLIPDRQEVPNQLPQSEGANDEQDNGMDFYKLF